MGDWVDGSDTKKERKKNVAPRPPTPDPHEKTVWRGGWCFPRGWDRLHFFFVRAHIKCERVCVSVDGGRGGGRVVLLICFIIRKESNEQAKNNKKGQQTKHKPNGNQFPPSTGGVGGGVYYPPIIRCFIRARWYVSFISLLRFFLGGLVLYFIAFFSLA